jgi:hypothetical protein
MGRIRLKKGLRKKIAARDPFPSPVSEEQCPLSFRLPLEDFLGLSAEQCGTFFTSPFCESSEIVHQDMEVTGERAGKIRLFQRVKKTFLEDQQGLIKGEKLTGIPAFTKEVLNSIGTFFPGRLHASGRRIENSGGKNAILDPPFSIRVYFRLTSWYQRG